MISKYVRAGVRAATITRSFSTSHINFKRYKISVIGGAGGTGQMVALMLKNNPLVYKLSLYDIADQIKGIGVDLSHISTQTIAKGYNKDRLFESLECCDIIIFTQGGKRKPNMRREDHWNHNAEVAAEIARAASKICPSCYVAVISNPINSLVPLISEIFKQECALNPNHIFGLTAIDKNRAKVFIGEILGVNPECVDVPVIGGHSNPSIIPVLSQCQPPLNLPIEKLKELVQKIQLAGETVARAKNNQSGSLSMAYCAVEFTKSLLKALNCEPNIKQHAYVRCDALGTKYCVSEFILGGDGISKLLPQPKLAEFEDQLLQMGKPDIKKHVARGEEYAERVNPYTKAKKKLAKKS